jgi:hypothetical protein
MLREKVEPQKDGLYYVQVTGHCDVCGRSFGDFRYVVNKPSIAPALQNMFPDKWAKQGEWTLCFPCQVEQELT